jgi:imidazole glycerol-phosphate synthase subunit HisF
MLKIRVIPTLLWKTQGLVKGVAFDSWRRVGTVLPAIKVYNTRDVDEIVLLDITATGEGREPDYNTISELSSECFIPLTIGGGVNCIERIFKLLRAGADKITINSAAYENPSLIQEGAKRFGSQCIVVSIDAKKKEDRHECFSHCGSRSTGREVGEWAKYVEEMGAGEILITSIDRDGTMLGYDIPLVKRVVESVNIPVIASGGAGNYQHLFEVIEQAGATAVAAASIFHFTEQTPKEAKQFLSSRGVPVRGFKSSDSTKLRS